MKSPTIMSTARKRPQLPDQPTVRSFRRRILSFYKKHGRHHLPFRLTTDPYAILVSEIMLQQTQVERVIPKWEAWIQRWPDVYRLSGATSRQVLTAWSGLGYNRRALHLYQAARTIALDYGGVFPDQPEELITLPGIGPYTANAVAIFAYNAPIVTIDANIRRVLLHEFNWPADTSDRDLHTLATLLLPRNRSRDWHNALMDYSRLALPRHLEHIPPASRQSRFEGSLRQVRGEIIRRLTTRSYTTVEAVARAMNCSTEKAHRAARALAHEGTVTIASNRIRLSGE